MNGFWSFTESLSSGRDAVAGSARRMMRSLRTAAVIGFAASVALAMPQGAVDANDPVALASDAGAAAFHKNCAACHSIGGQGTGEDISFTLRVPESRLEQEVIAMEKFTGPLELDQIMDLIGLMKSTEAANRLKAAKEEIIQKGAAAADSAAGPAPAEVHPGGKAFAESCATCHIIGGQGALTGTDISFTVHWQDDAIKNSIKKMEKYTGVLPPEKVQALTELMKLKDAGAHIKAAKGGAAVAEAAPAAPAAAAPQAAQASTATATSEAPSSTATAAAQPSPAAAQATAETSPTQVAAAPPQPAATEAAVTTTPKTDEENAPAPDEPAPAKDVAAVDANDPVALADDAGAAAFHKNCAACHSIGGQGAGEDISFTLRVPESRLEQEVIAMEKYTGPLELDQIMDLIGLMKSTEAADRLKTAKEQIVEKGPAVADAAAGPAPAEVHPGGKAFAESCATCHIINGQGALTGTDISFTVHWTDDAIQNSIKKMEKYTGALPPEKVQALTELMKREDAAAHIKAARGGAAAATAAPAATAAAPAQASTATAQAQAETSPAQVAEAPAKPTTTEWSVTTATRTEGEEPATTEVAAADAAPGDPAAALFLNRCSLCHTIGGGMLQGPDLAPTRNKPVAMVEAAVRRMQVQAGPLDETQIKSLTELIVSPDFKKRVDEVQAAKAASAPAPAVPTAAHAEEEEVAPEELGKQLFHGELAFAKGGVSCNSCHSIGRLGGTAAPDLRNAYSHLGEEAVLAMIQNSQDKPMHPMYKDRKITAKEAEHLVAYLKDTSDHPPRANPSGIPLWAIAGAVLAIGFLGYLFRPIPGDERTHL